MFRCLSQDRERGFRTLHRSVERVAFDRLAPGLTNQLQQFGTAQTQYSILWKGWALPDRQGPGNGVEWTINNDWRRGLGIHMYESAIDQTRSQWQSSHVVEKMDVNHQRAVELLTSNKVRTAFDISQEKEGLPELVGDMQQGGAKHKTKGVLEAAGEKFREFSGDGREREPAGRRSRREEN